MSWVWGRGYGSEAAQVTRLPATLVVSGAESKLAEEMVNFFLSR